MPITDHQVTVRDESGNKVAIVTDFLTLAYSKRVNQAGFWSMLLAGEHPLAGQIDDKYLVEIERRVNAWGIEWYKDFFGIYRDPEPFNSNGIDFFRANGCGQFGALAWRRVAYYTGYTDRSYFTSESAETIAKTLVTYNATASATTGNGRLRNGPITNFSITVEADAAGGDTIASLGVFGKDLITALSRVTGKQGGGDVDLIYDASSHEWEFRWYEGQRGTDRTADVLFALNYDNMENPKYTLNRSRERTVAIVAGRGEGSARDFVIRTSGGYAAANDIETLVNATDIELGDTTGLQARGDQALVDLRALDIFDFTPKQTEGYAYGSAYCVDGDIGDLVSARYNHPTYGLISGTYKIVGVDVSVDNRGSSPVEQIKLILEEWS